MKSILLAAVLVLFAIPCLRAEDTAQAETIFKKLIAAQLAKDYDAFVADGTDELKAALSKTQFEASSNIMTAKLSGGYDITMLGEINQHG